MYKLTNLSTYFFFVIYLHMVNLWTDTMLGSRDTKPLGSQRCPIGAALIRAPIGALNSDWSHPFTDPSQPPERPRLVSNRLSALLLGKCNTDTMPAGRVSEGFPRFRPTLSLDSSSVPDRRARPPGRIPSTHLSRLYAYGVAHYTTLPTGLRLIRCFVAPCR